MGLLELFITLDLAAITAAIQSADTEIRTGMFPAVSSMLIGILLIAIAAGVVWVIVGRK